MKQDDVSKLSKLGSDIKTRYENPNVNILETFPNQYPENDYNIEFETSEFTSLCPKTGFPDFATIKIIYQPKEMCIETKSLKLYLHAYRNHQSFMETNTNKILEDLVQRCNPKWMVVIAEFTTRGGIKPTVVAKYGEIAGEGE